MRAGIGHDAGDGCRELDARPRRARRPSRAAARRRRAAARATCHVVDGARRTSRSMSSSADGNDARRGDRGDRVAGSRQRGERADDRALLAPAERQQLQGDLGDDAERALGPDHERREVVAGHALRRAAAERAPRRRRRARRACRARSRGSRRTSRSRCRPHSWRHCRRSSRCGSSPGRADTRARARRRPRAASSLMTPASATTYRSAAFTSSDARHALEREHDAARRRVRAAREPGARSAGDDVQTGRRGQPHHVDHVLFTLGQHHGDRRRVGRPLGIIVGVRLERRGIRQHLIVAQEARQVGDDACSVEICVGLGGHASEPRTSPASRVSARRRTGE